MDENMKAVRMRVSGFQPEPPSYLSTRVAAHVRELHEKDRQLGFWKWATGLTTLVLAITFLAVWKMPSNNHEILIAKANEDWVVRITYAQSKQVRNSEVAYVEVLLPEGVHFSADGMPQLALEKSLTLAWTPNGKLDYLPIPIRAELAGVKQLRVRYLGANRETILEKSLEIDFRA